MSYQMQPSSHMVTSPSSNENYCNLPEVPYSNSQQEVMMWQQNTYMSDSGFNSGTSTRRPPSLCGKENFDSNQTVYDWGQPAFDQGFNQEQIYDVDMKPDLDQTSSQCMQALPQLPKEGNDIPPTQFGPAQTTTTQQVPPGPSQMFKFAFSNCLNGQDDIDVTSKNTIALVKLLKDSDHVIVSQTVKMVQQFLEKDGAQEIVLNTPQMVASLVDVLNSSSDLETTKCTAGILHSLSQYQPGLLSIYQSNGIPALVKLLSAPVESVLFYAVTTLHNLLLNQEGSKAAVCKAGGLQKMVMLLKHNNENFLSVVTDCLQILAYRNQENKLVILSSDGPAELVRIMGTYSCKTLLWTTSRVLKVLSVCSSNKRAIIAAGGMQALAKHLNNPSQKLVINCLWTLRNLSDAATKQGNVASLLQRLVQLLGSSDKNIVTCTAGILSNMTCNNDYNKVIVCQAKGISALVNAILEAGSEEEIIEPAICTLRHLTCRHPEAETAQNAVRLHSGLQAIVKLLHPPSSWPLIKAVIGLVRNLALCPNNHEPLRALGTVHILRNMLHSVYQDVLKNRGGLTYYETQPTIVGGVKMEDIVEGTLSALLNLSRNVNCRALVKDLNIMNTLVQILYKENENIQCIVAGLFCEIASDPGGILIVESAGAVPSLCTSLRSKNEGLASQSASLLIQLFTLKPQQYQFLSTDMNKIMGKDDSVPWQELLKSSSPSVTPESGYQESQGSFNCPSGSRPATNQAFDLQPIQNSSIQEPEDLNIKMDLDIPPDLNFDSAFDALQPILLSPSLNEGDASQDWFNSSPFN
ncbi:catenin beta-like [Argiope bruennichi]|uniref:Armadillo segment polarity protein n=1 Tax=Argiope bruennichi TaxID=94029 RepID=A0A8T0E6I1_ARGBR|nr:catenin beta-like [Argiope bruennichi]KAF8766958.1 Catenin beta like protein [Argiope bruennichi]